MQIFETVINQHVNVKTKRFVSNAIVWLLLVRLRKTPLQISEVVSLYVPELRFCAENNKQLLRWAHEPKLPWDHSFSTQGRGNTGLNFTTSN